MAAVTICVILEPKKIKSVNVSIFTPSFAMKWWDQLPWFSFFECWVLSQLFHSPLSLSSRGSLVPLPFFKIGVICISEVIDISPGYLNSSWCFIQPDISQDVHYIEVKLTGWQYTALIYSLPNLESVCCSTSSSNCYFWPAYRSLRTQVRWSSIPISWKISHSLFLSTQSKALA